MNPAPKKKNSLVILIFQSLVRTNTSLKPMNKLSVKNISVFLMLYSIQVVQQFFNNFLQEKRSITLHSSNSDMKNKRASTFNVPLGGFNAHWRVRCRKANL